MNLRAYFWVIFVLKVHCTEAQSNKIGNGECTLNNNAKNLDTNKIKEKYSAENGFGVTSLLKSDGKSVASLKDPDGIKNICGCFAISLYSKFQFRVLSTSEDIKIDSKYSYCVKYTERISWSPMYCSPIVKCTTADEEFFIVESKTSYEERKFRDVFVFELSSEEKQKLDRESANKKINYPKGEFIAFYSMVDLEYFWNVDDSMRNEISFKECKLNDIEKSSFDVAKQEKLKDQFYSEYGFGVLNYAKLDWGSITSLQTKYVKRICLCFAKAYYPHAEVIKDLSEVEVKTNYYYCKEYFFPVLSWFKKCPRSPVVQCTISTLEEKFYLVESVKFYFSRRFRNICLFILGDKDSKYIEGTKEIIINNPAGTFELFAAAVNLQKCL